MSSFLVVLILEGCSQQGCLLKQHYNTSKQVMFSSVSVFQWFHSSITKRLLNEFARELGWISTPLTFGADSANTARYGVPSCGSLSRTMAILQLYDWILHDQDASALPKSVHRQMDRQTDIYTPGIMLNMLVRFHKVRPKRENTHASRGLIE